MEFVDKKVTKELIEVGDLVKSHDGSLGLIGYDNYTETFITIDLEGYVGCHFKNLNVISVTLVTKGKDLILTAKEK